MRCVGCNLANFLTDATRAKKEANIHKYIVGHHNPNQVQHIVQQI